MFDGLREASVAAKQMTSRLRLMQRMVAGEIRRQPQGQVIQTPAPANSTTPRATVADTSIPPGPSYGFHNPAPAGARQLPPPRSPRQPTPVQARDLVLGIIGECRAIATALTGSARILVQIADALEAQLRPPTRPPQ